MLDTFVSGLNELLFALESIFSALTNMLFALTKLPSMASNSLAFMGLITNVLPPFIASFFVFGSALAIVQWALPGKIGGK